MRSFLNYMGGKSRLARVITARLPATRCYVEVFGGAGWVLFAREPSPVEVFNDADGRLVNLFRVVRERPAALARALALMPRSRRAYYDLLAAPDGGDGVRAAAAFYYLVKNAFSGRVGCGFSAGRSCPPRYAIVNDFATWARRLNKVTLEDLGYEECLARYDGRDTAFYLDPPYMGKENYYGKNFGAEDHARLARRLRRLRGRWLVSYNDCAAVRRLYEGYHIEVVRARYSAAKVAARRRRPPAARELLIANFEVGS